MGVSVFGGTSTSSSILLYPLRLARKMVMKRQWVGTRARLTDPSNDDTTRNRHPFDFPIPPFDHTYRINLIRLRHEGLCYREVPGERVGRDCIFVYVG